MRVITKLTIISALFSFVHSVYADDDIASRVKKLEDKAVLSGNQKIKLSGHLNRAALWLDNGHHSNVAYVDNDNSASRINLTGVANFNDDIDFGSVIEIGLMPNSSSKNDVHHAQSSHKSEQNFRVRIADVFMDNQKSGDMASYYTMSENDFSGTRVVADGANVWEIAGGASFSEKSTKRNRKYFIERDLGEHHHKSSVFANVDGLGRHDRVRYDSPKYYGFQLSTSHGYQSTGDLFDVAARFAGKFVGIRIGASLAYENDHSVRHYGYKQINGSLGLLLPLSLSNRQDAGISLSFAAAKRDWDAKLQRNGHFIHGKIGYIDRYFFFGNTAFAVDYADSKNITRAIADTRGSHNFAPTINQKGHSWGAFLVQNVDVVASELFAGYRNFTYKRSTSSRLRFHDIHAVMVGVRVKL
jgi:predicted porin